METITIPKKLAQKGDLVIIPRREYEALVSFIKSQIFTPTPAQKKALKDAEKNFVQGKTLSYHELVQELGFAN